jgi:hypothetical protein
MSDYDQRQYRLMLEMLTAFEQGTIDLHTLGPLIDNLEGLLNVLQSAGPSWKDRFLQDWGVLEDTRGFAIFKGAAVFNDETTGLLRASIAKLKLLALEQIDDTEDRFRSSKP